LAYGATPDEKCDTLALQGNDGKFHCGWGHWEDVSEKTDLPLKHSDNSQQAFSSEQGPTLDLAIPALEALHKAWPLRAECTKYVEFIDALAAGVNKVVEYYNMTAESNAYIFAMCMSLALQ